MDANDGVTLLDNTSPLAENAYTDIGLTEGAFFYYTLFVRVVVGSGFRWRRSADTTGLVVADYKYSELLLDRLPSIFTTAPASVATHADVTTPTAPFATRFLSIFGFQLDNVRTTYETLRLTKDADRVAGVLLPLLARELGQTYEPELGQRQNRVLLRNSVYLYKKRGTTPAITGLASALTGYGADLLPVTNLVADRNTASAELSVGTWYVRTGSGTLARRASDTLVNPAVIPAGAVVGYRNADNTNGSDGMFQVTATAAGSITLATVPTTAPVGQDVGPGVRYGIPIDPTLPVAASVFLRDTGTSRIPTIRLDFYDRRGVLLTAPTGSTASGGATASDWSRRQTYTLPAASVPAAARYVGVVLTYPTLANGEVQLYDAVQVEQAAAATGFRSARAVRVSLNPQRTQLVTNPSFEVDLTGWTTISTTATRSTAQAVTGTASLALAGTSSADGYTEYDITLPVGVYTASAFVYLTSSNATFLNRDFFFYGQSGTMTVTPTTSTVAYDRTKLNQWQRVTSTVNVTVAGILGLRFYGPNASTMYIDGVLLEKGAALLPYFDGSTVGSVDVGWTGTAHASSSVLYTQRAVRDARLRLNMDKYLPFGSRWELVYADAYKPS